MQNSSDALRHLLDECEDEKNDSSAVLSSLLSRSSIFIDEKQVGFTSTCQRLNFTVDVELDSAVISTELFSNLAASYTPCEDIVKYHTFARISDAFDDAERFHLMQAKPSHLVATETSKASHTSLPSQIEKKRPIDIPRVNIEDKQLHNVKPNPFKSAKVQFANEGGVLESRKPKTDPKSQGDFRNVVGAELPEELQKYDKAIVEQIMADIVQSGQAVTFAEIAGLDFAKRAVEELICWPMARPDLFQGLRALPRGVLLFGPPGTGKTLIGKAIAHQAGATFFSISASSLTSKWIGQGEKAVRVLFAVAVYRQPAVVFIDEVDSLLCQRSSDENEASRRIKTEFLVQLDGASTNQEARVVILGATNRPEELDEAARRRFVKRIYIPLPDTAGRAQLFHTLLRGSSHCLSAADIATLVQRSEGYSGADIRSLCTEAAMCPVRQAAAAARGNLRSLREEDVPPISQHHFLEALDNVACSVSQADLKRYIDWNAEFGSFRKLE